MIENIEIWHQYYLAAVFQSIASQTDEPLDRFYLRESQELWCDMINSGCVISLP